MKIILIFKVGYMSLFIDFLLIFMLPLFHIYIDLKLYLHIPPFINMLIGHIFVLRKELLKEKKIQMFYILCGMLKWGGLI